MRWYFIFKIRLFVLMGVFIIPAMLAASAAAQDIDCEAVMSQLPEVKAQYKRSKSEEKKAFENWDKYYQELHSFTYEATDQPLAVSAEKCKTGDYLGKDFCKGAIQKFDEISAKEAPAKVELDAAKAKTAEAMQNYNDVRSQSRQQECNRRGR